MHALHKLVAVVSISTVEHCKELMHRDAPVDDSGEPDNQEKGVREDNTPR